MDGSVASAIVLDMDGVLLRTNDAKYRAMLGLFERYPAKTTEISEFILRSGGVPRAEKLKYILESIVGIVASEDAVDEYLVKYEHSLEGALSAAPFVAGVEEFLSSCECPLYLCSSAPASEVARQLSARNLDSCFAEVFDGRLGRAVIFTGAIHNVIDDIAFPDNDHHDNNKQGYEC